IACGDSDEPSPEERLQGVWLYEDEGGCAHGYSFKGDEYEYDLICFLDDGTVGIEAVVGTFSVDGERIELDPDRATCPGVSGSAYEVRFGFVDDLLRLSTDSGIVLLEK